MAKKANEIQKLTFEQAIESLTEIVEKIENGQVSLAESLEQYEKGMAMIKHCRGILLDAEKRIERIAEEQDEDTDEDQPDQEGQNNSEDEELF